MKLTLDELILYAKIYRDSFEGMIFDENYMDAYLIKNDDKYDYINFLHKKSGSRIEHVQFPKTVLSLSQIKHVYENIDNIMFWVTAYGIWVKLDKVFLFNGPIEPACIRDYLDDEHELETNKKLPKYIYHTGVWWKNSDFDIPATTKNIMEGC